MLKLEGMKFGRLLVIRNVGVKGKQGLIYWECLCDCGNTSEVPGSSLKKGNTQSCGCLGTEARQQLCRDRSTHGMHGKRIYNIWRSMRARCTNSNYIGWDDYGGRGISVCAEWLGGFEVFYSWALANGYSDELTIDRKNTDGNYEPENCRWATVLEQQNNRRDNRLISYHGVTDTISQFARSWGIRYSTLLYRIESGWSVDEALERSPSKANKRAK